MPEKPAISITKLEKTYKGSIEPALKGISLDIPPKEIYGLLGPNGAGKTTTINILCGLLDKSGGEVHLNGWQLPRDIEKIKKDIGVVPQDIALYPTLTAMENLSFIGKMYGLKGRDLKTRIDELLEIMGLSKYAHRRISTFSGGMKRRINLIAAIMHRPRILFLDEPTVGVDVQSRNVIIELLFDLKKNGCTIIYTSHYMEEAESLCDHIAIIDHGQIIISGRPGELIGSKPEFTNLENVFLHLTGRKLRDY